ncbi:MAG: helix-turn-helix domain-containing protein, partial [bacterium]
IMAKNFDKKISLAGMADFVAISPKYLSRVFEEVEGIGFSDYKLKIKTDEAKKLLMKGYTVEQVSDELGYRNPESFIRIFKKITGKTPSRFRSMKKTKKTKNRKKGRIRKVAS